MKFAKIIATGRVHGVWFRDFVKKNALALNLNGWVRNNSDGTVGAGVEGEEEIINQLIDKIKIGSPLSKVEDVKVNWQPFENKFNSFKIIR
ncbi:MAG: acylphosphatase [Candidatus Neomarinimicrobiota bacterium]